MKARLAAVWIGAKRLWREHRWATVALIAAIVLVIAGIVGIAYDELKRPADIHNAEVPFQPQKPKAQKRRTVGWPLYGYDRARTRYLPARS